MELTGTQIIILGLIASVLVQAIKLISAKFGWNIGDKVTMVIVFVVSLVTAFLWIAPTVPITGWDIPSLINYLIEQIGAVLGFSVVIYVMLLKLVFEKLDLTKARFIGKG